jgi:hypothetical protein
MRIQRRGGNGPERCRHVQIVVGRDKDAVVPVLMGREVPQTACDGIARIAIGQRARGVVAVAVECIGGKEQLQVAAPVFSRGIDRAGQRHKRARSERKAKRHICR